MLQIFSVLNRLLTCAWAAADVKLTICDVGGKVHVCDSSTQKPVEEQA